LYAALRHATLPPAELDVLAVGDPAFDRDLFVQGRLPEAEEEARRIAALYRRPELLTGADATEERFLELAPRAAVVHFGGHAEVDPRQPGRSRLLLAASETPDGGALHAHELQELRLSGTRLVVLGACSTAVGQRSRAEGVMSLAYAFMAAGAPAVVASLWDVNDGDAATLLVRFHERLAAGRAAPDALREAQLEVIAAGGDARSPSAWAAFQLFGDASLSND
jgi:CHAT domain-containing protein